MASARAARGAIERGSGVSRGLYTNRTTRRNRLADAVAAFGADRRTNSGRMTKGGKRAMSNVMRRRSLGGNGG